MNYSNHSIIIPSATNGFAVVVCLLAAILVCGLKLYRQTVYRLALYQVLASLAVAIFIVLEIIFVDYYKNPGFYSPLCVAIGWFVLYSEWMKLFFTMWVTFHLFCFGVFHKNLKKLEVVYVVTSVLVPAMVASVPLTTHTYGLTTLGTCWIAGGNDSSLSGTVTIEWFALWYGSATLMLLAASTAMVVMVIKLTHQVCWRYKNELLAGSDRFIEALNKLLPLAAFPILFFVFSMPSLVYYIYLAINPSAENETLSLATSVSFSMWGVSSGVTLIIHIGAVRCRHCTYQKKYHYGTIDADGIKTVGTKSLPAAHSATSFPLPAVSIS